MFYVVLKVQLQSRCDHNIASWFKEFKRANKYKTLVFFLSM